MSKRILGFTAVAAAMLMSSAMAQQASPFYMGASLGSSSTSGNYAGQVRDAGNPGEGYSFVFDSAKRDGGSTFAGRIYGGYRFNRYFATELGYTHFGSHDVNFRIRNYGFGAPHYAVAGRFKLQGLSLDAVGTWPINDAFSVNGRLGVMATRLGYSDRGIEGEIEDGYTSYGNNNQAKLHWGVGAAYKFNRQMALTLDYQRVQNVGRNFGWCLGAGSAGACKENGKLSYDLLSVGVRYDF